MGRVEGAKGFEERGGEGVVIALLSMKTSRSFPIIVFLMICVLQIMRSTTLSCKAILFLPFVKFSLFVLLFSAQLCLFSCIL